MAPTPLWQLRLLRPHANADAESSTWEGMGGPARIRPYLLFQRFRPSLLSGSLVISSVNPSQKKKKKGDDGTSMHMGPVGKQLWPRARMAAMTAAWQEPAEPRTKR